VAGGLRRCSNWTSSVLQCDPEPGSRTRR
jgi:hypothetical protein